MITIIAQLAVLALTVLVFMLWRRTHRLERGLHRVQQELEIQRVVIDQPDTPPRGNRHLRTLSVILLL